MEHLMENLRKRTETVLKQQSMLFPLWDKVAGVRSRPRRIFAEDNSYCYPIARQPLCLHKLVSNKGKEVTARILLQTAYKFMHDIAYVEIELINNTALKIYNGIIDLDIPKNTRNNMLSVIIDEAYHAYVAIDFIEQVKNIKKEELFYPPQTVELKLAMNKFLPIVPDPHQGLFEVICICLGENTLTNELFEMTKYEEINPFFREVMADHMSDEGRHSSFFRKILSYVWCQADEEAKDAIGRILPHFVIEYLDSSMRREWDKKLLSFLNFNDTEIEIIIKDIYPKFSNKSLKKTNPVAKKLLDVLDSCYIFTHKPTRDAFVSCELIEPVI